MDVTLRPVCADDLPRMMEWRNRPENRKWFFDSRVLTPEDQERWYAAYLQKKDDRMFIIEVDSVGIGTIGIYHIDTQNKTAEIGRVLIGDDQYRGRGYAYRAGLLLVAYAFDSLQMERLYLSIFADNKAAYDLYSRLGFVQERIVRNGRETPTGPRDVVDMALQREAFMAKRPSPR